MRRNTMRFVFEGRTGSRKNGATARKSTMFGMSWQNLAHRTRGLGNVIGPSEATMLSKLSLSMSSWRAQGLKRKRQSNSIVNRIAQTDSRWSKATWGLASQFWQLSGGTLKSG